LVAERGFRAERPGVNSDRVIRDLRRLAAETSTTAGAQRVAWSDGWYAARRLLRSLLAELAVRVETDEAGNLWAYLDGDGPGFVVVGSHLDSVPDGGWLDGALGVMTAVEVLRQYAARGRPPVGVAMVDFADEEGRFGRSLLGSAAVSGSLVVNEVRGLRDRDGAVLGDVLAQAGVPIDAAPAARRRADAIGSYLELHIEQGPVLEREGLVAAAVVGCVGIERHRVTFTGQASHGGTTPTADRRDALAAAARLTVALREIALREGGVCTVGRIDASPGIATAVAGEARMLVDQRHLDAATLAAMLTALGEDATRIGSEERCTVTIDRIWRIEPLLFDPRLVSLAADAVRATTGHDYAMPSGALHDAAEMSRIVPTAMLFCASTNGLSHTAAEDTPRAVLETAIRAFGLLVDRVVDDTTG
jgi:hydantoinase/carbamoylase family amidase